MSRILIERLPCPYEYGESGGVALQCTGMKRCLLLVLDSVGIGELPDAHLYGDAGCDTLGHVCAHCAVQLPNLERLGLGYIRELAGVATPAEVLGAYGRMREQSPGKDSITGHWELAGVVVEQPFRTFPGGFPQPLVDELEARSGRKFLANQAASGTQIIADLGAEHQESKRPILYTSADPVLQIAAHEDVVPLPELYALCSLAFEIAVPFGISRVIARPFVGSHSDYRRTKNRRDFSLPAPRNTVLDCLQERQIPVVAIGKVAQLFAGRGISKALPTTGDAHGVDQTLAQLGELEHGLIFTNLVDFDTEYGHRRDVEGYARALERFDQRLPSVLAALEPQDLLVLTADHGNDPTFKGTDHTREFVPLMVCGRGVGKGEDLGTRDTFADVAACVAGFFDVPWEGPGRSFLGK